MTKLTGCDTLLIDEEFLEIAKYLVGSAEHSICIATFKAEITPRPRGRKLLELFELMFEKSRVGVNIRFILDGYGRKPSSPQSNIHAANVISNHNIKMRSLPNSRCCHAKMILVDNSAAIIGSHNLSVKSCSSNFEISYLITDNDKITQLQDLFNHLWKDSLKR